MAPVWPPISTLPACSPRITASWEPRLSRRSSGAAPPAAELADYRLDAKRRVTRSVEAIGPELSGVALDVCCFGKGLQTVERELSLRT